MTLLTPDDHLTAEAWAAKALAAQALPQNTGSPKELKKKKFSRAILFQGLVQVCACFFHVFS